jgi:hypothetical protein
LNFTAAPLLKQKTAQRQYLMNDKQRENDPEAVRKLNLPSPKASVFAKATNGQDGGQVSKIKMQKDILKIKTKR